MKKLFGDKVLGISLHEEPGEYISGSLGYAMGASIFEKHKRNGRQQPHITRKHKAVAARQSSAMLFFQWLGWRLQVWSAQVSA